MAHASERDVFEQIGRSMLLVDVPKSSAVAGRAFGLSTLVLAAGVLALFLPTMFQIATSEWTLQQGGHGPIVVATGAWLLWRELGRIRPQTTPGKLAIGVAVLAPMLSLYVLARITGILEIEAFAMYFALIAGVYLLFGGALLRAVWFPLIYLALALPPPDSVVAAVTQPLKIGVSQAAVALLHEIGYPIAGSGVTIEIAQYQLLVAAACAGLNSIISLSAICIFYSYLRHRSDPVAFAVIALSVIPIATFSNFVRVLVLILITYYFGESAAQGFLHDFAGLTMFTVALLAVFGIDSIFTRLRDWRASRIS